MTGRVDRHERLRVFDRCVSEANPQIKVTGTTRLELLSNFNTFQSLCVCPGPVEAILVPEARLGFGAKRIFFASTTWI